MNTWVNLSAFENLGDDYVFIQNDSDLASVLESVGLPKGDRKDITGAMVVVGDGDYEAVWLCEDNRYYDLSAIYRPLPFYRPKSWRKSTLPTYWRDDNELYQ